MRMFFRLLLPMIKVPFQSAFSPPPLFQIHFIWHNCLHSQPLVDDAVISCFGTNVLVQNKFLYDSIMLACFGDKDTPSLFDAIVASALRILASLGWNSNSEPVATVYETLYMLSNNHLMSALKNCAALVAWMCESMDGAVFVASDVRSVSLLTRICLTGCCMADPERTNVAGAGLPSFQALSVISAEARANLLHSGVGAMVSLSRLISAELLLTKSITEDSLLLASWRLAHSSITFQHPANALPSGADNMHQNFLDVMYVAKFSQVSGKLPMAASFDIEDGDTNLSNSVQATPAALRQVALSAYFENMLAIKDVRAESLNLAENKRFAKKLGACSNELRGLLCGLGWGVISTLRVKGSAIVRLRELFTAHLAAAGYHHTALVPLQSVERFLSNPQHSMSGEFVDVLLQWSRCAYLINSYRSRVEQAKEPSASTRCSANADGVSLSLQCVISILSPVLAGDNDCNFKIPSKFAHLLASIQDISRYFHCSVLFRTRLRLIAAANKIKYCAKRAVFNRYVGSKLLTIVRASQPESIWPSTSKVCISWGSAAADIAESAAKDWQTCRRHVKRMNTNTDRLYQGRARLSMHKNDQGGGMNLVYTVKEKAERAVGKKHWNISSSESEDDGCPGDSDDSCDSLADIEKEDMLDGTNFSSGRMHLVSELPINAFTPNPATGSETRGYENAADSCVHSLPPDAPVEVLDLTNDDYIQKQLQAHFSWGAQNLLLKSKYLERQVCAVQ